MKQSKRILAVAALLAASLLAQGQNGYTRSRNYTVEKTYTDTAAQAKSFSDVVYTDGFGRRLQKIQVNGGPSGNSDLVTAYRYGTLGQVEEEYLPYSKSGNGGAFDPDMYLSGRYAVYGTEEQAYAFSRTEYEHCPLARVALRTGAGKAWHTGGKGVRTDYGVNGANEVRRYRVAADGTLSASGYYEAGTLDRETVTDEDGHRASTYTDSYGRETLSVAFDGDERLETYYVYDDLDRLRYVLPPEASNRLSAKEGTADEETLKSLAYAYDYDRLDRVTMKRLPGCEPVYMVYDKRGRMALSQDGAQRSSNPGKWSYFVHDGNDRVVENGELVRVLTGEGYLSTRDSKFRYFLRDHQGNTRAVLSEDGDTEEVSHYYPFGGLLFSTGSVQPYKYNGKELDTTHGLNWYDYGARHYDPTIGRWHVADPMAEKYYGISPYSYCESNPVNLIDPTGELASPIYDLNGKLLGTDDDGLQGDPIIMDAIHFRQGMPHEEALSHALDIEDMTSDIARILFDLSVRNLPNRPDYDGYLTLEEANEWYRMGNGMPLYVDLAKIDLSGILSLGEYFVGREKTFNLLFNSASLNDGLVFGTIKLKRYPNHHVRAYSDWYDFEMHSWWNPLNWSRNIETVIGGKVAGKGTKYEINIYGSKRLEPLFWFIK